MAFLFLCSFGQFPPYFSNKILITLLTVKYNNSNISYILRRLNKLEINMKTIDKDSLYYVFLEILRLHYYRTHVLLDKIGVYPGQPPMLYILNKKDGQSHNELATKLNVKPSTITVMVKRMEKANLVVRRQDNIDQRVSRVYITEEGRDVCKKASEVMKTIEKECFGSFNEEEKMVLRKLLMQMRDNLLSIDEKQ